MDVELPDTRCVADDGRHDDVECAERGMMKEDVVLGWDGMGGRYAGVSSNSRWRWEG